MYASISIYQLIWAFTEPAFQSIIIFDLGSGETYYNGLMEDYDGPDFEICSIDNLGGTEVDENGYPILIVNIDVNEEDEED